MNVKKKHAFCPHCLKEVKPKRKKLDNFNWQILIIIIVSTLGLALIPFLIYYLVIRKKKYCPKCGSEVQYYDSPRDFPKKIPVVNLLEKINSEKIDNDEVEFMECYNCNQEIEKDSAVCPYCGVQLKSKIQNPK
jgi:hypothetical protein